jgi:poly-gamma-glutamate capsule biosynthesis protein CapA/YwtB (metallophosphatase superfamily)
MKTSATLKFTAAAIIAAILLVCLFHNQIAKYFAGREQTYYLQTLQPQYNKSLMDYYQEASSLASNQTQTATATFLAVGDIMFSRNVAQQIQETKNPDLLFQNMAGILKSTDFNFANLESPVAPLHPIVGGNSLIFGAASSSLQSLKDFNFEIINLANNHAFDQGLDGVNATIQTLDNLNINHEGTGDNLTEAWTPAIVSSDGIKICFVGASYSSINDGGKATNDYVARMDDPAKLQNAISMAKNECDFVVATMHGGTEYSRTPNLEQITFAHEALNDGANIVIGAHPHWVQPVEKYCPTNPASPETKQNQCTNPKYIFYSLGNFVFDQNWSEETKEGLALKITLSKPGVINPLGPGAASLDDLQGQRLPATLVSIELVPIVINDNSQPSPATGNQGQTIINFTGQSQNILN